MKLILFLFIILPVILLTQGLSFDNDPAVPKERFTVIAPTKIRQGKPFNIHIRGFSLRKTIRLAITINGTSDDGDDIYIRKNVKISRDNSGASLSIDTSEITKGTYRLFVEGGKVFEKRTLIYDTKKYSIFILLSKGILSPGDLLQYKIFVIDTETKSVNRGCKCSVRISDSKNNGVSEINNLRFINGRYAGELKLSNVAGVGVWKIRAKCDNQSIPKNFEVQKLNPSIVEVKLTVDERILYSSGKASLTVEAFYVFGRPAYGKATVIITTPKITFKKNITVDDEAETFEVDFVKDLNIERNDEPRCDVELIFEDVFMQRATYKTKFVVTLALYRYVIENVYDVYTPGKPYNFKIILINDYTNEPAQAGTKVQVKFENPDLFPSFILTLDEKGSASSSVFIPKGYNEVLNIDFVANDAYIGFIRAVARGSNQGPYLNLNLLSQNPSLNDRVKIKITTGTPTPFVMLHIIAKGVLLKSTRVWFDDESSEDEQNTVIYSFSVSTEYIPLCTLVAYYIDENGTFIVGDQFVRFEVLNNYLKITPSTKEVRPGSEVELDIESMHDSTVSLVAFDQRYLLNRGNSIITLEEVFDLHIDFGNTAIYDWGYVAPYERSFGISCLYVFTNIPRPRRGSRSSIQATVGRPTSNDIVSNSGTYGFSESAFLWEDIEIGSSGHTTISRKVPNTLTSYVIFGISSNEFYGVGLPEKSTTFNVFKPFSISVEFPYSIKRNEVYIQKIILFNYVARGLNVEVKIKKNSKFDGVNLDENGWEDSGEYYVQSIASRSGMHFRLNFALRPKVNGFITFEVTAKGPLVADKINKQIRVVSG